MGTFLINKDIWEYSKLKTFGPPLERVAKVEIHVSILRSRWRPPVQKSGDLFWELYLAFFCIKNHATSLKKVPWMNNFFNITLHLVVPRGQNSKQINVAKYISKFLIYSAKMLEKCVKSKKKIFVHCPFLQSQAK